jgi:excisionase family DNA binding protein
MTHLDPLNDVMDAWLTPEDVRQTLAISISNLRGMARRGEIPAYRIGRAYRFNEAEILDWIREQRIKPEDPT